MAKIYYLRHQAAGVLTQFPFSSAPTDEQIAAVAAICDVSHGSKHAKTEELYWLKVVEQTLFGPSDMPEADMTPLADRVSGTGESGATEVTATGVGRVENPKEGV